MGRHLNAPPPPALTHFESGPHGTSNSLDKNRDKNTKKESNFVLRDVNFKINKGSKIGILGVSGSGKSTFLDLLMGLISPQSGEILIDGKKIKNIKSSWQKIIGCVPQDVFILDDTIKRNVAFGLRDSAIDVERVKKAIELANLNEFLKNNAISGNNIASCNQIHSDNVLYITKPKLYKNIDGLITHMNTNIILKIQTADCIPIFIIDEVSKLIGLIHSGWKGTKKGIIVRAIKRCRFS